MCDSFRGAYDVMYSCHCKHHNNNDSDKVNKQLVL